MKRHQTWIVARSTPWPDGTPTVEIATELDYLDPAMLDDTGGWYGDRCNEYDNPVDAARAAVEVRARWAGELGDTVEVGLANPFYPAYASPMTDEDVLAWGERIEGGLPVCAKCGAKRPMPEYQTPWGELFHACDDHHANEYVWEMEAQEDAD